MDRTLLTRCGKALYGEEWLSPLSRELGIGLRTMHRWRNGESVPKPATWNRTKRVILELLAKRRGEIGLLETEVNELIAIL